MKNLVLFSLPKSAVFVIINWYIKKGVMVIDVCYNFLFDMSIDDCDSIITKVVLAVGCTWYVLG